MNTTLAKNSAFVAALAAVVLLGCSATTKEAPATVGRGPQLTASTRPTTMPEDENVWVAGRTYLCRRARGKVTIDRKDHPEQWAHAMVIRDFVIPISHEPPQSRTAAQMLWDDECLYVRAVARDTDLRGTLKGQFARLWTEDAVELFLKPPAPDGYYEFEMSPTNVLLDLKIPIARHTTYRQRASWESRARLAVAVEGTIERPDDTDRHYRILMAIPWKSLAYGGARPPKLGEKWKFIFARCDLAKAYGDADTPAGQELSTCIRLPKVDFHMYEIYPEMEFAE